MATNPPTRTEIESTQARQGTQGESDTLSGTTLTMIMTKLEKLDRIDLKLSKLDDIEASIAELKTNTESFMRKTVDDLVTVTGLLDECRRQQTVSDRKHQIAEYRIEQVELANRQLKLQINDIENRSRLCNIKLEGKYEDTNEDLRGYMEELAAYLVPTGFDPASILTIHRIGKIQQPQMRPGQRHPRPRTVLVTVRSVQERNTIFYARTKLRDANSYRKIYLNDDTTTLTRKMRENYRAVAALAQANGNNVKIHGDGIIIDGRKYKHAESDQLPPNLSLAKAKTVTIDGGIYFSSEHSYMSNFYPAPCFDNDIIYPTAEHRLQAFKCEAMGDLHRLELVKSAPTPLEAKKIGDQITETPQWRNGRDAMIKTVVDLKFNQHPELAGMLADTGDLTLHEATMNAYYGIGATIHSREMRDKSFTGANKLGLALQAKRQRIRAAQNNSTTTATTPTQQSN